MTTRREFLKGIGKVGFVAALPPIITIAVDDVPTAPAMVGLWVDGREVSGTGYRRLPLTNVGQVRHRGRAYWDADDVTWYSGVFTADEIRLFDDQGRRLASIPIAPATVTAGDFIISWSPEGLPT